MTLLAASDLKMREVYLQEKQAECFWDLYQLDN